MLPCYKNVMATDSLFQIPEAYSIEFHGLTACSCITDSNGSSQTQALNCTAVHTQEAARLMAAGEYELALPVALDAVQQGQLLFKPSPALQLFPLYLLAAQVCTARRLLHGE